MRNQDPPEEEEDESRLTDWDLRCWKFRRAVEILIFDDWDPELDEPLYGSLKELKQHPPHEYILYLQGEFDGLRPSELPACWNTALMIIRQIQAKQADNEAANAQ